MGEKMATLPKDSSPNFSSAISKPCGKFSKVPAAAATCRLQRHCGRGRCLLDAVARRKTTQATSRVVAGSWCRLRSRSVKCVHLQSCSAVKENLAQVGDAPGCRANPSVPVESGYGRQKVFCQRVITNIATYNVRTLKAKWRQQELVGFLERELMCVQCRNIGFVTLTAEPNLLLPSLALSRWMEVSHSYCRLQRFRWCRVSGVSNTL